MGRNKKSKFNGNENVAQRPERMTENLGGQDAGSTSLLDLLLRRAAEEFGFDDHRHLWKVTFAKNLKDFSLKYINPLKEIEITTNKLTTMCLKYAQFAALRAYKLCAYKK